MMTLVSRVKVLAVLSILIFTLSILVVTRDPARAASQASCSHTFVPSPNVGPGNNDLLGVTAISSSDVWAVGYGTFTTLIEHWNGTSWSVVPSPSPGTRINFLYGVTANSTTDVWAVGDLINTGGNDQALIEHWNGISWSVVPGVNFGSRANSLFGVTAISSSDVWAVGDYAGANQLQPLVEQWNGSSWSVIPNPAATHQGDLHGIAASNFNKLFMVGEYFNQSLTVDQTLTMRWADNSWLVLSNPSIGTSISLLTAVSALKTVSGQAVAWAVGEFENTNGPIQTLAELIVC